jgi:hypothetical protein
MSTTLGALAGADCTFELALARRQSSLLMCLKYLVFQNHLVKRVLGRDIVNAGSKAAL